MIRHLLFSNGIPSLALRGVVSAYYAAFAVMFFLVGLILITQGQLNLMWETEFYGRPDAGSVTTLLTGMIGVVVGGVTGIAAVAWLVRTRPAGLMLLGTGVLLILSLPFPINALTAVTTAAILWELWPVRARAAEEDEG